MVTFFLTFGLLMLIMLGMRLACPRARKMLEQAGLNEIAD